MYCNDLMVPISLCNDFDLAISLLTVLCLLFFVSRPSLLFLISVLHSVCIVVLVNEDSYCMFRVVQLVSGILQKIYSVVQTKIPSGKFPKSSQSLGILLGFLVHDILRKFDIIW